MRSDFTRTDLITQIMQKSKDNVWKIGEKMAREYLENKGYKIIEQNYRTKYSEIDIIVKKPARHSLRHQALAGGDNILVFVEVRTKTSRDFVSPEESINQKKLKKLYWNAETYVANKKYKGRYRVDAICIVLNSDNAVEKIEHYKEI